MGGAGKTYLATKLAHNLKAKFAGVFWFSLREAPPLRQVLEETIKFLSHQQEIDLPQSLEASFTQLIALLNQERWLIDLDNAESILKTKTFSGEYRKNKNNLNISWDS